MTETVPLKDYTLLRQDCLIDGQWTNCHAKNKIDVINPATDKKIGSVPDCGSDGAKKAINAAQAAFGAWQSLTALERGEFLLKWEKLAMENLDDLATILTLEEGKPLAEAKGEILQGLSYLPWFAAEARRACGQVLPPARHGIQAITRHTPLGVCAAITPWNFPFSMLPRKLSPALAAGCTAVVKPSGKTPFSALAFLELGLRAGIPSGVINAVTGNSEAIGGEIATNPLVRKISFTGSTKVGKALAVAAASTLKRMSLELGGNAPFIVFPDADMEKAINMAMGCKFRNAGQTCICANRFLIEKSICADFADRLAKRAESLCLGNGLDSTTDMGPLINQAACDRVDALVQDAISKGATLLTGGKKASLGGNFYDPTVLLGIKPEMRIFQEEIFGPVAAIMEFDNADQAVTVANDTNFGLASYVCTSSIPLAWKMFNELEYGMLGVDDATLASADAPFGGIKDSGMGREGGTEGIMEYMETRYMLLGNL